VTPPQTKDYGDLSTSDLAKLINNEYELILAGERSALQKAIPIGQMLIAIRPRVTVHGKWQDELPKLCPKISYETATLYMRFADPENLAKLLAAGKSVTVTDLKLTVREARELLAKPKAEGGKGKPKTKASIKGGVEEPGNEDRPKENIDQLLQNLAADELFAKLKEVWDDEELKSLTRLIMAHASGREETPPPPATATGDHQLQRRV